MNNSKILVYDGSFNGFLTAIFVAFDEKIRVAAIQKHSLGQSGLFSETQTVMTQVNKAKRVWDGIQKRSHAAIKNIYFAYLSEQPGIELLLFRYVRKLFSSEKGITGNYSDEVVLKIGQLAKSVGREKHRMEAFVRFQLTKDGIYFAAIEPVFDVLPLITKHFRSRYADQYWLIYDVKRKYGVYYDLEQTQIIALDLKQAYTNRLSPNAALHGEEYDYQDLWNNYFKSTNIRSRINLKLHTQHLPKRYWKYLSEKKPRVGA